MKSLLTVSLAIFLTAAVSMAAVEGEYIEARNADVYVGACYANSEVGLAGDVAVMGWRISRGSFQGVALDGLNVVAVVRASGTLGNVYGSAYPVKSVLILDERANAEQRLALRAFAQRIGGDLLSDVVRVDYQPIEFNVDGSVHNATASLTAGSMASLRTRAIHDGDHVCANAEPWYKPLNKVGHAMPAYVLSNTYKGEGLDTRWSNPENRGGFVASFQFSE
jgi:hypothetical protein